jgi:hypothetical protein
VARVMLLPVLYNTVARFTTLKGNPFPGIYEAPPSFMRSEKFEGGGVAVQLQLQCSAVEIYERNITVYCDTLLHAGIAIITYQIILTQFLRPGAYAFFFVWDCLCSQGAAWVAHLVQYYSSYFGHPSA